MTDSEKQRFDHICQEINEKDAVSVRDSIGTYSEKRLHRILKRFVCDDETHTEIKIGKYIADIFHNGHITEIQTGSLYPLKSKLKYYLENTDLNVTVIRPIISEKTIIRAERETGEILYKRRSPKRTRIEDMLPELYWISEFLQSPRINVRFIFIKAEEVRFSERMRYRKEGAFDSELYPKSIIDSISFVTLSDYEIFLPPELSEFTSSEYSDFIKLKGRRLYSALNLLCSLELIYKEKENKKRSYIYKKSKTLKN